MALIATFLLVIGLWVLLSVFAIATLRLLDSLLERLE